LNKPTVKIDWLTFTFWRREVGEGGKGLTVRESLSELLGFLASVGITVEPKATGKSRRPYTDSYLMYDFSAHILTNPKLEYVTVEFTGKGCSQLHQHGLIDKVINYMSRHGKPTRVDAAIDIKTDVRPSKFVADGYSSRIKSFGHHKTVTGETIYLGSPKSDWMVRVYRYDGVHERSGLLRIELVARRDKAVKALKIWQESGPNAMVAYMSERYKFGSKLWEAVELDVWEAETSTESPRTDDTTIAWLMRQVKPALARLAIADKLSAEFWHLFFQGIPDVTVTYGPIDDDDSKPDMAIPFK